MKKIMLQDNYAYANAQTEDRSSDVSLSAQIICLVAMLGLCYASMPAFIGAGSSLLTHTSVLFRSSPAMHEKSSPTADIGKTTVSEKSRQFGDGVERGSSASSSIGARVQLLTQASSVTDISTDTSMTSLSRPDQHWQIAQAFNTAQNRKKLAFPMQAAPLVVVR